MNDLFNLMNSSMFANMIQGYDLAMLKTLSAKLFACIIEREEIREPFYSSLTFQHKIFLCTKHETIFKWLCTRDKKINNLTNYFDLGHCFPNGPISTDMMSKIMNCFKPKKVKVCEYHRINKANPSYFLKALELHEFDEIIFDTYLCFQSWKMALLSSKKVKIVNLKGYGFSSLVRQFFYMRLDELEIINCHVFGLNLEFLRGTQVKKLLIKNSEVSFSWHLITDKFAQSHLCSLMTFEYDCRKKQSYFDCSFIEELFKNGVIIRNVMTLKVTFHNWTLNPKLFESLLKTAIFLRKITFVVDIHCSDRFFIRLRNILDMCSWLCFIKFEFFCANIFCDSWKNKSRRLRINEIKKLIRTNRAWNDNIVFESLF